MVRVVYRLKAGNLDGEALARSWQKAMLAICRHANGAVGGELLRSEKDPQEYLIVTHWQTVEAWREFWSKGPPEPQGDPALNEIFTSISSIDHESLSTMSSPCKAESPSVSTSASQRRGTRRLMRGG